MIQVTQHMYHRPESQVYSNGWDGVICDIFVRDHFFPNSPFPRSICVTVANEQISDAIKVFVRKCNVNLVTWSFPRPAGRIPPCSLSMFPEAQRLLLTKFKLETDKIIPIWLRIEQ